MELFVYGTLTDREQARAVLGENFGFGADARLEGLHRVEGEYPTLAPGGRTEGRILRTSRVEALDEYEGVDRGLYVRVAVPREDGERVQTYVGDPRALGAEDRWPEGDSLEERVRRAIRARDVRLVVDP